MSEAAAGTLLVAFHISFESPNDSIITASFHYVERILTKKAQNGVLDTCLIAA